MFWQKGASYKFQFCTKACPLSKADPLGLRDVRAEYKDKLPDMWDSHWNIGTPCNSKLK